MSCSAPLHPTTRRIKRGGGECTVHFWQRGCNVRRYTLFWWFLYSIYQNLQTWYRYGYTATVVVGAALLYFINTTVLVLSVVLDHRSYWLVFEDILYFRYYFIAQEKNASAKPSEKIVPRTQMINCHGAWPAIWCSFMDHDGCFGDPSDLVFFLLHFRNLIIARVIACCLSGGHAVQV